MAWFAGSRGIGNTGGHAMIAPHFSRRRLLQYAAGTATTLAMSATDAPAQTKGPQQAAGYQDMPNGSQRCGNCRQF